MLNANLLLNSIRLQASSAASAGSRAVGPRGTSVLSDWGRHMSYGIAHAFGAEPARQVGDQMTWRWFGKEFFTNQDASFPRPLPNGKANGSILGGLANTVGFGVTSVLAYATGGMGGVMTHATMEFALQGAMARHAYTVASNGAMTSGRSVLAKSFNPAGWTHWGLNQADYFARLAGGHAAGMAASHLLGGGLLGTVAAPFAATLGVKLGPKLAMPGLAAGAAALTGYAAYSVAKGALKAGYNHAQMKKSIQTSGDMAAFSTAGAHTMRQRAVMAINKSHLNARSALGQEASYMHFPSRSYHSRFRQVY